jgi:hypothetical protein
MSRMVNTGNFIRGCSELFEGDDEAPSPSASIATTKYFAGSIRLPAPTNASPACAALPRNHDVTTTTFEWSAFSLPYV